MSECLIGKKFNKLMVIEELKNSKCRCICDCENEKISKKSNVKSGLTTSCGCVKKKENLVGQKFNKLTIVEELKDGKCRCICDCGCEKILNKGNVKGGYSTSCGCAKRKENLIGQTFSYLKVIDYKKSVGYVCSCGCGNITTGTAQQLKNGHKKSCGECNIKKQEFEASIIGQTFNELTVISRAEQKETCKSKNVFWNCKCSCGKDVILSTNKLKIQLSCGHKNAGRVHNGLSDKYKHIYKKWNAFKQDDRLSQEFLEFKNFLNHILTNLNDRINKYGYLMPIDDKNQISPANITWKYLQHVKTFCDVEYKWCSNCERYVQNSDKFWTKKKGNFCRKCIFSYSLKSKYNLEYKDYLVLLNKCNRQCQICSGKSRLVVDHCHISGKIRGILCSNCNSALGQFSDNVEYLGKAIEYLGNDLTNIKYNVKKSKDTKVDQICPITNTDSNLVVDHCHETNLVRGTIDFNVNIGIGLFNDDINTVKSAISYLNKINS